MSNSKITRVSIGDNKSPRYWKVVADKNSAVIERQSVFSRLKLAKPLVDEFGIDKLMEDFSIQENKDSEANTTNGITFHHVSELPSFKIELSKENYNVLLKKNKNEEDESDSLLILDMSTKVKLLRYNSQYEIINTYHSVKTTQRIKSTYGCFIKLPENLEDDTEIIRIQVLEDGKYYQYIVKASCVERYEITSKSLCDTLDKIKANGEKFKTQLGFIVTPRDFPSMVVTIPIGEEDNVEELSESIKSMITEKYPSMKDKDFCSLFIPTDYTDEDIVEALKEFFDSLKKSKVLSKNTIKTITSYNSRLSKKVLKELKINYAFTLAPDGRLKTTKSN